MSLSLTPRIERIARAVTGRPTSLLDVDLTARAHELDQAVRGARILVAGGAGTIGSATILELVARRPAAITVFDPSENNLAELVRTLRSASVPFAGELSVQPFGYGSALAARYLRRQAPFDYVMSFAALKHVRSERDGYSLARMLEVNLLEADRFLQVCRHAGHGRRGVFMVSTDKAARPVSLMGASKRAMELLLWAHGEVGGHGQGPTFTQLSAARFANVAFSDGSLPWAFLQRIEKRQPLALPVDVKRYLVSPQEAGQFCLISALLAPSHTVMVPALAPGRDEFGFDRVAEATLTELGLRPRIYDDEAEARRQVEAELARGHYPVVLTRSDTNGEKPHEEFVCEGERARDVGLSAVHGIEARSGDPAALGALLSTIARAVSEPEADIGRKDLVGALGRLVPELRHIDTGKSLDAKM